jgi:hypothetical protein
MINQFTVEVSVLLEEAIAKDVPAMMEAVGADNVPGVPPRVFAERKILELAVTAVVLMTMAPAVIAAEVPREAFEPVAIESLFPAVPRTKFPLVAVMFPRVAVIVVAAVMLVPAFTWPAVATIFPVEAVIPALEVRVPVTAVLPVALPIATAPVPPVPMVVVAAPEVLIVVVPTALKVVAWTGLGVVLPNPRTGGEAKFAPVLTEFSC